MSEQEAASMVLTFLLFFDSSFCGEVFDAARTIDYRLNMSAA